MQHVIQGGSSSPGPNPDFEARKSASAHSAAINSNEKIFPIFAKKLSSRDTKEFSNTARKFAVWLGSEKAYYQAARPKIVELLEIALTAFMDTFVHHSAAMELAEHLRQLVQAVIPFIHLFSENELQSRLQRVIRDTQQYLSRVSTSTPHGNVPPQGSVPANIPSPVFTSPVHPQPTMPPAPGSHPSMWQIQPSPSGPSTMKAVPEGSVHDDASRAHNPSEVASPGQINANSTLLSAVTNSPHPLAGHISPTIPPRPQPKRAQRAELPEELIARDLDWFKSNQVVTVVNGDSKASSPKANVNEFSPVIVSDIPHISTQSLSPRKKTARMVPSRRLPRRISLDVTQEAGSSVSASAFPLSESSAEKTGSLEDTEDISVRMDADEQNPSMEETKPDTRSVSIQEARGVQDDLRNEELPSPEPPLAATSPNGLSPKPEISGTDHSSPSAEAPSLDGDSHIFARPSAEIMLDRTESMDISNSEGVSAELSGKLESISPQSPEALHLRTPILPSLVKKLVPPLNLKFRISPISLDQLQQLGMDASQRRFDEMTVIHSMQGKPFSHTHMIDISMTDSNLSKISKWVNRRSSPSEASEGVCISLGCYCLPEFFDRIKSENGGHDMEELTSRSSCSWPQSKRLFLHVNDKERLSTITLCPPLSLTPDHCVDVSSRMKLGKNTLEIKQQDDLSEYLIVLHAHRPTRAQLAELDLMKTADERWKYFLSALSARTTLEKTPGSTTAGVVGVS